MLKINVSEIASAIRSSVPAEGMKSEKAWCAGVDSARRHIYGKVCEHLMKNNADFDATAFCKACGLAEYI